MKLTLALVSCLIFATALIAGEPAMEMRLVVPKDSKGAIEKHIKDEVLWVAPQAEFTSTDVKDAFPNLEPVSTWTITLIFTDESAKRFGQFTGKHIGSRLAILVNGKALSAPNLLEPITGGSAKITGSFSEDDARKIATAIMKEIGKTKSE